MNHPAPNASKIPAFEYVMTLPNADPNVTRTFTLTRGSVTEAEALALRGGLETLYGVPVKMVRISRSEVEL